MLKKNSLFTLALISFGLFSPTVTYSQKTAKERIYNYFLSNSEKISLSTSSVNDFEIDRTTIDEKKGITHHYIRQTVNGLPVLNGTAVFVEKDGDLILTANRLITGEHEIQINYTENALDILDLVWKELTGNDPVRTNIKAKFYTERKMVMTNPAYSNQDIPMEQAYFFDGATFRFVFEMNMKMKDGLHWWNLYVDANTGEILEKINWTVSCSFINCSPDKHFTHRSLQQTDLNHQLMMAPAPPPQNDSYHVFQIPVESPNHGSRSIAVGPFNGVASPFGWHDDDGVAGLEYTITRGNNVYASEDADDNDSPGYSPNGGSNLVFDFPYNGGSPSSYLDASITNLFYMNNIMHDVWYHYGFDEQSGNFQQNNYGKGGTGSDYVNADAQDGSGTNNANFSTPPDGGNPRMQMYIWTNSATSEFLEINAPSSIVGLYLSSMASFAPQPPTVPITEDIIMVNSGGAEPMDACNTIVNFNEINGKIALVKRGSCTFALKVENCQAAGALAVIVINNVSAAPVTMGGSPSVTINIPAIMVSQTDGNSFLNVLSNNILVNGSISDQNSLTSTDSDLDNMIIAHEYGHGISNRLTGGPNNTNCLGNEDQMGEGWSDWFGLVLTIESGDQRTDRRGVGTYVENQPTTGQGIRPVPYSTDFSINGFTYNATNSTGISQPHGIGFVWCTALWDLTWDFIEEYGFDPNVYTGGGGNNMVMELVMEGMKLQPCSPGAVDGRDAIILADQLLNNGINECLIWNAFAKRGLGFSASQGDPDNRFDQNENFTLPMSCLVGMDENYLDSKLTVYPNPTENYISITSQEEGIENITLLDINGRQVFNLKPNSSTNVSIDMTKFEAGIYFVVVEHNNIVSTRKIIKE
jgi:extracellular elastinolytic metalloproteinase